ncbi:radical SAM protein [Clostridioides difficile]
MECTLYLTDYCNLRCSYCYQGDSKKLTFLSRDRLEKSLEFIINTNVKGENIYLNFLGGEPLLKKELIHDAVNIINRKYKKYSKLFKYSITTNCILIDDKLIKLFKDNEFDVSMSIDGDEHTHNINRKSIDKTNKYEVILSNIKKLNSEGIKNNIRMTITKNNVDFLYNNVLYFHNLGFTRFCLGIDYFADWDDISLSMLDSQLEKVKLFYLNNIQKSEDITVDLFDGKFTSIIIDKKILFCNAGTKGHLVINSEGDLYPCTFVSNDEDWSIGNIDNGLNSTRFKNTIRKNIFKGIECDNCSINFTCQGRKCGFLNYSQTKYLNKSTPLLCKIEKIIYRHNTQILKEFYKNNNSKLMEILNCAKEHNLKLRSELDDIFECSVN